MSKYDSIEMYDHLSGNPIRPTNNGPKDCDLPGINQNNAPLELDDEGLPLGWIPPTNTEEV